jgi:hypothetical protein
VAVDSPSSISCIGVGREYIQIGKGAWFDLTSAIA